MAKRRKTKGRSITVDFTDVEKGVEVGEYKGIVDEVSQEEGPSGDYIKWKFKLEEDGEPAGACFYNTSLTPQSLWNLRNLLEAMGIEVPASALDIDFDELLGKELTIKIDEEEYEGRMRPKMVDFWEWDEEDGGKKKKSKKDEDEEEEEDEDEKPRRKGKRQEVDEDEDEEEEDEKPKRRKGKRDEEEEDEDEEEDDKPKGRKGGSSRDNGDDDDETLYSRDDIDSADEKQLAAIVKRHKLRVELSGSVRRQRERVANALEKAELLEDDE